MLGQTISHYRIAEKLGEGGMGVVYKAEDLKLGRTVALKLLLPHLVSDEAVRKRFLREAQAAAALSHANICTVYEIDDSGPQMFIAMEFVAGANVAQKITPTGGPARPLPLDEALEIAIQTAAGLQEAHEKGVIHRDIKSANVLLTPKGSAKITDFGLAQLSTRSRLTKSGTTLGTPAFMSPEQAQNLPTDHRTDIWSLGVMLYEMVAGRLPFDGDYEQAIVYSIINEDPAPITSLRTGVPSELERILGKILAKNPAERYQHADDLKVDLERVRRELTSDSKQGGIAMAAPGSRSGAGTSNSGFTTAPESPTRRKSIRNAGLAAAAVIAAAVLAVFAVRFLPKASAPSAGRTIKFTILPTELRRGGTGEIDAEVSVSRSGKHIAYVESEGGQLWIRDIDQVNARLVPGATRVYQTFWSPDDRFIGYAVGRDLMRIPVEGGTPALVCKMAGDFRRATFSPNGETIVYCDTTGLYTVPAIGGAATRMIEHAHIEHPSILELPDGRQAFLFQALETPPNHGIYAQRAGEERRDLIVVSSSSNPYPVYSETGHIVYVDGAGQSTSIWAIPFSPAELKATGEPFRIAQNAASPALSRDGTMVYSDVPPEELQLIWCDRSGKRLSTIGEPALMNVPALSPDGRHVASVIRADKGVNIWIYDVERQTRTRFTTGAVSDCCVAWPRTGEEITFASNPDGNFDIFSKRADGSGEARRLVGTALAELGPTWSPDGKILMYAVPSPETKNDLYYRERRSDGEFSEPAVFLATPSDEFMPQFSPDGRFVLYVSDESGRNEVYVRGFPGGERKWQISTNGGAAPRWRGDGREIYYVESGMKLMAVTVSSRNGFSPGTPVALFENPGLFRGGYDAAADGQRFVVRERLPQKEPLAIHIVHNWFEEFRDKNAR